MARTSSHSLSRYGNLLAPHVLLIRPPKKNILTSNSLLFFDEKTLIIDTGSQRQYGHLKALSKIVDIDNIFFSHYHIDHIVGSHILPNTKKYIHELEKTALHSLENYFLYCYQNRNILQELKGKWFQRLMFFLKREGLSTWERLNLGNVQSVQNGVKINIGVTELQVIHLPGHSPGHCGVYDPLSHILFIGDMEISSNFGPWYGWPNSDLSAFRKSVSAVIEFIQKHDISLIVSSHSREVTKVEGLILLYRFTNFFDSRSQQIFDYISCHKNGVTLKQIADQSFIYKGKESNPSFVWEFFELIHVEQHIKELLNHNQIQMEGNLARKI